MRMRFRRPAGIDARPVRHLGRPLAAALGVAALLASAVGVAGATGAYGHDSPHRVAPLAVGRGPEHASTDATRHSMAAASDSATEAAQAPEFQTTANPTTLDPPVVTPPTHPTVVTVVKNAAFGNGPPPAMSTVDLPTGRWSTVVLSITGTEKGTQYDRLLEVFDGPTEIFLGVTPEPTPAGITWHVEKNVTGYLPILAGQRTFSTYVDNYLSSVDNGIPTITVKLLFYPAGHGFAPARPASLTDPALSGAAINEAGPGAPARTPQVPSDVVPLVPKGQNSTLVQLNAGQSDTATVDLPSGVTTATLDLYAVGQIGEEFWWSLSPSFRELQVWVDGKPAGVVWPFPYVYTGGVNPLIWRPLTGIHTLDIPAYRIDLTPFAGLMHGPTTVTITVTNNTGYWLVGGSLLVTAGSTPTAGSITADTLSLPTTSHVTTSTQLGSSANQVLTESAATSYRITGTIRMGARIYVSTVDGALTYDNDQTLIDPSCSGPCYQWVQGEVTARTTAHTRTPSGRLLVQRTQSSWTIDAPNGYLTNASGSSFLLPTAVSQVLTNDATQSGIGRPYATSLQESIVGEGTLGESASGLTAAQGDTTGTITYDATGGQHYQRVVVARGGVILEDVVHDATR